MITLLCVIGLAGISVGFEGFRCNKSDRDITVGSSGEVQYATISTDSLAVAGYAHNAILLNDGQVFVTYGITATAGSIYNPITDLFTPTTGTAAVGRTYTSGITKLNDGRVYICGFGTGSGTIDPPELFDQVTGCFTYTSVLLEGRC
jgi:hypothetical protein